ncbi:hypothetical protein GLYMA_11G232634v4 [Glycine max]|nr:hypothetical protein GLYMA_11G232634v4 [Glycine max]KAH1160462.1 hypothetical protein GYH30_031981 [Glycine max]
MNCHTFFVFWWLLWWRRESCGPIVKKKNCLLQYRNFPQCHCSKSPFFLLFYFFHFQFRKGCVIIQCRWVRRRRRQKSIHSKSLCDSVLGQKRSAAPKPQFLLSKAPPMNAAAFAKLAAGNALFQAAAGILRRGEAPLLPGGLLQGAQKMTVGENKMSALDMNDGVE